MKMIRKTCLWMVLTAALLTALCGCDMTFSTVVPTEAQTTAASTPDSEYTDVERDTLPSAPTDTGELTDTAEPAETVETAPPAETVPSGDPPAECVHIPASVPAVAPTCTQVGYTEGSVCGECGAVLTQPEELPAAGHSYAPENEYNCTSCGEVASCPTPLLSEMGERVLKWGDTLTITWHPAVEPLFPVVYMVMVDGQTPLWDGWSTETAYSRTAYEDGELLTLTVMACYAVNGVPVAATQSISATLTLKTEIREALEPPIFLSGNEITVDPSMDATVAWGPVTAEGAAVVYEALLLSPDGTYTPLTEASLTGTVLTIPAEILTPEGDYTLSVIARDEKHTYRESPAAALSIHVRAPAAEGEGDFKNPTRYASTYYYDYLATQEKGDSLRRYYRLVDTALTDFHSSYINAESVTVSGGKTHYYAAKLDFSLCGLTLEEAVSVRFMYLYDHPLYYWISNVYVYTSSTLYFCVLPEYVKGVERMEQNAMIYEGVETLSKSMTAETSAYSTALACYERLLGLADYAYEDDGETPQDDHWAHSIVGVFDPNRREVVCEGFAKAYGLLLTYHGVENIPVPGVSRGVGHLWNLVRLDDGAWYWCDITWDDTTHSPLGTDHKYFCVTDTQDVLYYYVRDGIEAGKDYTFSGSSTFLEDHTVRWDSSLTLDMSGAIPARSETPYGGATELILRESFTVDGMTYVLTGYGRVQLISVGNRRSVTLPATVTYGGVTYTVSSVGLMREDGVFMTGRLLPLFATSVYVSENISYVWEGALSGLLVNITVDPNNPWYTVENGILRPTA